MKNDNISIAIVGCGVIGRGWAIVFARAGAKVRLFDVRQDAAFNAVSDIEKSLRDLLLYEEEIETVLGNLFICHTLEAALDGADYAQESITETVEAKRDIFTQMDRAAPQACILASSCSSMPPDMFLSDIRGVERCLIAHPFNPPHLIPVVEVAPSRQTSPQSVERAKRLLFDFGQHPVVLNNPVAGYIGNRLQAAIVSEVMHLVAEGVASPEDIDACMRLGLGMRWSLMGPLETMDLNADKGIEEYIAKFGADYQTLSKELGVKNHWTEEAVRAVAAARRKALPADQIRERMAWRDRALLKIKNVAMQARERSS